MNMYKNYFDELKVRLFESCAGAINKRTTEIGTEIM